MRSVFSGQQSAPATHFGVSFKAGIRDHALLLMYRGTGNQRSSEEVRSMVGLDTDKEPCTRCIVAKGRGEIEGLLRTLYRGMNMYSMSSYETNAAIPDWSLHSVPEELHPSTWSQLAAGIEESKASRVGRPATARGEPSRCFLAVCESASLCLLRETECSARMASAWRLGCVLLSDGRQNSRETRSVSRESPLSLLRRVLVRCLG